LLQSLLLFHSCRFLIIILLQCDVIIKIKINIYIYQNQNQNHHEEFFSRNLIIGVTFVFVSISGVQGQSFGSCILSSTTADIDVATNAFFNSQTIYSILFEDRDSTANATGFIVNPNFTTLCTLLESQTVVKNLLNQDSGRYTFFAPDNTALAGVTGLGLTPAEIQRILETHIIDTPILLKDLPCGECLCTVEGGTLCRTRTRTLCHTAGTTFQVGGGNTGVGGVQEFPQIGQPLGPTQVFYQGFDEATVGAAVTAWGTGNDNIIQGNNQGYFSVDAVACNGIIHAVNKLILPGVGGNQQCGTSAGGKGSKGGKGSAYYGGKGSAYYGGPDGYYGGKGAKGYGGYGGYGGFNGEVIIVEGNGGFGGYGGFVEFGRKGSKGYYNYRRELDTEDTFFEEGDEEEDEDEVVVEEAEDSSVPSQQDNNKHSSSSSSTSTFEERSQRRRRLLESLIGPQGQIEQLE